MKEKVALYTLVVVTIVGMVAIGTGTFMMFMAQIKEFGWLAIFSDPKSLYAVKILWAEYSMYRIGLISQIVGVVLLAIARLSSKDDE